MALVRPDREGDPPATIELQPKPELEVHVKALDGLLQDGRLIPTGVPAVGAPSNWFALRGSKRAYASDPEVIFPALVVSIIADGAVAILPISNVPVKFAIPEKVLFPLSKGITAPVVPMF